VGSGQRVYTLYFVNDTSGWVPILLMCMNQDVRNTITTYSRCGMIDGLKGRLSQ
jgi:hypothetical protein